IASYEAAEGNKIETVKRAEADAEAMRLRGIGVAAERTAIVNSFKTSVEEFRESIPGSNASDIMRTILMGQYFDTLKELSHNSKTNTSFVSHNPANVMEMDQKLASSLALDSMNISK